MSEIEKAIAKARSLEANSLKRFEYQVHLDATHKLFVDVVEAAEAAQQHYSNHPQLRAALDALARAVNGGE